MLTVAQAVAVVAEASIQYQLMASLIEKICAEQTTDVVKSVATTAAAIKRAYFAEVNVIVITKMVTSIRQDNKSVLCVFSFSRFSHSMLHFLSVSIILCFHSAYLLFTHYTINVITTTVFKRTNILVTYALILCSVRSEH